MGLFKRSRVNTNAWQQALTGGSFGDFSGLYDPTRVNADLGRPALLLALSNTDPAARVAIANRLLDDGARTDTGHPLHVLLAQTRHDPAIEAPLLGRPITAGCSVNNRLDDGMTPLEQVASQFNFTDATLQPFYDVLLAQPDLDLLDPGLDGRTVLTNLRKWHAKRSALVQQAEAVLTARGIPVPPPTD